MILYAWSDSVFGAMTTRLTEATRLHGVFSFTVTPHMLRTARACVLLKSRLLFGFERLTLCAEVPVALYGEANFGAAAWLLSDSRS